MNQVHLRNKLAQREARKKREETLQHFTPQTDQSDRGPLVAALRKEYRSADFKSIEHRVAATYSRKRLRYNPNLSQNIAADIRKKIRAGTLLNGRPSPEKRSEITDARSKRGVVQVLFRGKWLNFNQPI